MTCFKYTSERHTVRADYYQIHGQCENYHCSLWNDWYPDVFGDIGAIWGCWQWCQDWEKHMTLHRLHMFKGSGMHGMNMKTCLGWLHMSTKGPPKSLNIVYYQRWWFLVGWDLFGPQTEAVGLPIILIVTWLWENTWWNVIGVKTHSESYGKIHWQSSGKTQIYWSVYRQLVPVVIDRRSPV